MAWPKGRKLSASHKAAISRSLKGRSKLGRPANRRTGQASKRIVGNALRKGKRLGGPPFFYAEYAAPKSRRIAGRAIRNKKFQQAVAAGVLSSGVIAFGLHGDVRAAGRDARLGRSFLKSGLEGTQLGKGGRPVAARGAGVTSRILYSPGKRGTTIRFQRRSR